MRGSLSLVAFAALAAAVLAQSPETSGSKTAKPKGPTAPDFPPGVFTDGGSYRLSDFEGKVLALYFFESA